MFSFNAAIGEIRMYGPVGPYIDGIEETDLMEAFDAIGGDDVVIHLQSEGGSVFAGLSMYNQIANYPGRVEVRIDSIAGSIASVIPLGADNVVANPNSSLMVHDAWTVAAGNARELAGVSETLDMLSNTIADLYAEKTGRASRYWRDIMLGEKWYNAEEALDAGLIDQIAGDPSEAAEMQRAAARADVPVFAKVKAKVAANRVRIRRALTPVRGCVRK